MKRLTLIQQNDTHAQMNLHWEHFWKNGEATYRKAGGFARIATRLNEFRKTSGSASVITVKSAIRDHLKTGQ